MACDPVPRLDLTGFWLLGPAALFCLWAVAIEGAPSKILCLLGTGQIGLGRVGD